jgi:hypothetical protein
MELGPNMKRLREMDVADSVRACVTTGPGDLMRWEVSACLDIDGMELEVIGRGPDLELAAASAMSVLAENGAALEAVPDTDPLPLAGDAAMEERSRALALAESSLQDAARSQTSTPESG